MHLIVDIGNTNITIGLINNNIIEKTYRIESDKNLSIEQYKDFFIKTIGVSKISGCMIASVVPELDEKIRSAIDNTYKIKAIFLDQNKTDIGIKVKSQKSEKAGADRIANAYAAFKLYGAPAIVVDAGTATTFDIIDEQGDFIGGIIMPGVGTQLKSLCEKASLLPNLKPEPTEKTIGIDTKSSILSGVVRGHAAAIDGLLENCIKELNKDNIKLIGTGGNFELVSKYLKTQFDYVNIRLTLEGIKLIYELNS